MIKYFQNIKKSYKIKNHWMYWLMVSFILIFGTISITGGLNNYGATVKLFEQIGYLLIATLSLSLVVGFLGELSLGHAAFMSIGAMFGTIAQNIWFKGLTESAPLVSLLIAVVIGFTIAGAAGFIIGLPALRLKGDYLAIVTLAFGEIVKTIFEQNDYFGAALGITNYYRFDIKYLFIIIFIFAIITLIIIKNLMKSKHGRSIMAIRDNEIAARAMGVNVTYYKVFVFVLSAALAGVAGVFYGASTAQIAAKAFNYNYSINNILVAVVLGGMGNVNGTIFATIIMTWLNVQLPAILGSTMAVYKNVIYALVLVLVVLYNNAPILRAFRQRYNLQRFANKLRDLFFKIPIFTRFKPKQEQMQAMEQEFGADWSKVPTKIKMDAVLTTDISPAIDPDKADPSSKGGAQ